MENTAVNIREALIQAGEAWAKFQQAMINLAHRILEHIKNMAREFVEWLNEIRQEPLQRYDLDHQKIIMREHQRASAQVIRIQERKMRTWSQPWKAWKAQRR